MKKKILKFLILTGVFMAGGVFFPHAAKAAVDAGGVQSVFELGGSARVLGMGGASVAISGEGDGFFTNPALLGTMAEHQILTFHSPLLLDSIYDAVGYIHPIAIHNSFGIALARVGTDNIPNTVNNIQAVSTFSSEQWQGLVGFGFEAVDGLCVGANVKDFYQQIGTLQGNGAGLDLGLFYHFPNSSSDLKKISYRNITFGLSASNVLQPQDKLFQTTDQPTRVLRPGIAYHYQFSSSDSLWLTVEGEIPEAGDDLVRAGVEYNWRNTAFGRVGFDGVNPTLGVGVRLYDFEFDYAFNQRDLGPMHRLSLSYRFGELKDNSLAQREEMLKMVARTYSNGPDYNPAISAWQNVLKEYPDDAEASTEIKNIRSRRQKAIAEKMKAARDAITTGNLDNAIPLVAELLSLDPSNPEVKKMVRQVDQNVLLTSDYMRGTEAYGKEDYPQAVKYLQIVFEIDPSYRDVKRLYNDAQSHYQPLESMSKDLTALYAQGVNNYMSGEYDKAITVWAKVLEKNPNNFLVQRNLDEARARLKEKESSPEKKVIPNELKDNR